MASTLISHVVSNSDRSRESSKKKKKKKNNNQNTQNQTQYIHHNHTLTSWKSESQQAYSSNLLHALHQIHLNPSPSISYRGQAIHEAADKVLAATAKGKTRWSRAILTNHRLKLKFMKNRRRKRGAVLGFSRSKKQRVSILSLKSKNLEAVHRKGRVLGRVIPGCWKEPLPVVLEEASDYIGALEMQIRAMAALAELLSGSNSGLAQAGFPESWLYCLNNQFKIERFRFSAFKIFTLMK